jgi:serine phosphatase RsbU (regulator of sigma subunit)
MNAPAISLLIVDDDPVFALFLQQLVKSLGDELPCAPTWVDSAEKALEEIRRVPYELVLLDYNLPGANGLEVLARIQDLTPAQRPAVIMLTGSGNEAIAVEAMKRGAKDYLSKAGLDAPPLTRAVQSALAQKRLAEQVARYNAEMKADLEMARNLQQSLLPLSYPCFPRSATPEDSALRFCHRYFTATELGGDFFSVFQLSDTRAGVFICDVMGYGVRSALVAAMLRALADDQASVATDPGQFLAEVNRKLHGILKQTGSQLYATAFYLIADAASGAMRYANAGHPLPLHLQRRAGVAAPLKTARGAGGALGLFESAAYPTFECPLAADDLVLLFTDGLIEVVGADGQDDYGATRLLDAARECLKLPPAQLLDQLVAGIREYSGGAEFAADVCLLAMEAAAVGRAAGA